MLTDAMETGILANKRLQDKRERNPFFCLFGKLTPVLVRRVARTVKGEVAEEGREHVHDEHGQDGQVRDVLHLPPAATVDSKRTFRNVTVEMQMCVWVCQKPLSPPKSILGTPHPAVTLSPPVHSVSNTSGTVCTLSDRSSHV